MAIDDSISRILFAVKKELHFRCIYLFIDWSSMHIWASKISYWKVEVCNLEDETCRWDSSRSWIALELHQEFSFKGFLPSQFVP